jgi:hypothetical protein
MNAHSETPAWMLALPESPAWRGDLKARLIATYNRIAANVQAEAELAREKALALKWCRNNGNPHLQGAA